MLRILHTSDLHGSISDVIRRHRNEEFDVWVDSGDFFPDHPEFSKRLLPREENEYFQSCFFYEKEDEIRDWIGDRPVISVPGNHDFEKLSNFIGLNAENGPEINGVKFSGFPEVPYCGAAFNNQRDPQQFDDLLETVHKHQPKILVTHTPPYGVLDTIASRMKRSVWQDSCLMAPTSIGCSPLSRYLFGESHKIKYHFFGHVHNCVGVKMYKNIMFINGSCESKIWSCP